MKRLVISLAILADYGVSASAQSLKIYTEIVPPVQIRGSDGRLSGICIDIVQEIQKRIGNSDPIQVVSWTRGYMAAQKEPNVLLFAMMRDAARNDLFQWVGPVKETTCSLWVRHDSSIKIPNLDAAKKLRRIGVYKDDVRDQFLTTHGFSNLIRSNDEEVNLKRLMLGDIDAVANTRTAIAFEIKEAGYKPEDVKEVYPFLHLQQFLAFSKSTPKKIVDTWQNALNDMKADGTFAHILHKYLPNEPLPGPASTTF